MTHQSEENTFLLGRLCKSRASVIYDKRNENMKKIFMASDGGREAENFIVKINYPQAK